ncbi:MAG: hypothetical protein FWD43_05975, partial [Coriobacteriia bacterium]|nr:hypothetical protein [Coriobacteriia bacterium]
VRKPLSDVFFDGFNYIEFINSEITRQILSYEYPFSSLPMEEQYLMRSYTGIPNDYPNYEVRDFGLLVIHFPMNNPFFENQRSFTIRLTEEISPYGEGFDSFTSTYHYARRMLPAIDLFTCDIKLLDLPDAAARINGQLRVWTDGFPLDENTRELLEEFASWRGATAENPYRFQPIVGQWQQYLSVSYVLLLHVGPSNHMPLVYTKCFDMTTGNEISLVDALPGDLPYKDMMFYIPIRHFEGSIMDDPSPGSSIPSSYIPDEGSVISIAWLTSGSLGLIITEPSGRELQTVYSGAWS